MRMVESREEIEELHDTLNGLEEKNDCGKEKQ